MSGSNARRRARRRRSLRRLLLLGVVLAVTAGAVYVGVRDSPTDGTGASPTPTAGPSSPAPSSTVDLSRLPIGRGPFCDRVDDGDVEDALGGPVTDTQHYDNGDRVTLAPGVTDVAHEYDCTYRAADGAEARVWVFAEPVTAAVGRSIVRDARREKGCTERPDAPTFGTPSVSTLCRTTRPDTRAVTLRGLFGDAWLTCRLSTPGPTGAAQTAQRADQWCVRVATTLGARP